MNVRWIVFISLLILGCTSLGVVPASGTTLFGLVNTGELFVSDNGGATWTIRSTLPVSDAVAIAAGDSSSDLYLATRSGLGFRSIDAGVHWTAVGAVAASDVVDMLIRRNGDILFLTATGILWQSIDDGVTFTSLSTLTASNHVSLTADDSGDLYVLTRTGEVARSIDDGATWSTVGVVTASDAVEIRTVDADLYVLTGTGEIARSLDHGVGWTTVGTISQVHMRSLTLDGEDLVASTSEGLIASSVDGISWNWVGSINQLTIEALGNDTPTGTGIGPGSPPAIAAVQMNPPWSNPKSGEGGSTSFSFRLPNADTVVMELYNIEGKILKSRAPEVFTSPGDHVIQWDMGSLASGVYFVRLVTGDGLTAHQKLAVVR